ncbi:MAG: hypothetical protein ACI39W_05895 [Brotaphodocola sp.]
MSAEELETFTAKNLAGFQKVQEMAASGKYDTEHEEKAAEVPAELEMKSADMTLEEILEKSSEIEKALTETLGTEPAKEKKRSLTWNKRRKMYLLAAAVAVLGLGTTMMVQGNRGYELKQYPIQAQKNVIANHNSALRMDQSGDLGAAYKQIEQSLDITVYELGDLPFKMKFKELILDKDYASMKFYLDGNVIYFKQRKLPNINEMSDVIISDRIECEEVYNPWLDCKITVERNVLDNGLTEYSAGFIENDVLYYLSGIMREDVFIDLVKNIHKSYD